MAGEFRRPVGPPLDLRDAGKHVEHPAMHVDRAGRVLPDHVEHGIAQPVVVRDRMDDTCARSLA